MKKTGIILILVLLSILFIAVYSVNPVSPGESNTPNLNFFNPDDGVTLAAKQGLNNFLSLIPAGDEKLYGFEKREDFLRAEVGEPLKMYSLNPGFLNDPDADLKKFIFPLNEWRVPVLIDGKMVSLLTVIKENDSYKCVDIGGSALATELNSYEKYFDKNSDEKTLLRLYQIRCDILIISGKNREVTDGSCYLLSYTKKIFEQYGGNGTGPVKFDSISPIIKIIYSQSLNQNKK